MSKRASWVCSCFHEKNPVSSCYYVYPFFFGLTCVLFASYKFLPSPFCLLVNSLLLAVGTIFFIQLLTRYSKRRAPKNDKNECVAHKSAPYKLNLARNDLRAKKLESFRFNPQVKSRRTFKGMKVRAAIPEEKSSSNKTDGKAIEEDDGRQVMAAPAACSTSWVTEDLLRRSRAEEQEQSKKEAAQNSAPPDEAAKLGSKTDSCCLGSPWCLVDHQETALDAKLGPVNAGKKPEVVDDGTAGKAQNRDDNRGEKAHKENDDEAHKEKDEGDKVSSASAACAPDVPRNPMNLGDSEQERTRRLESLIAKRKARKALERNQSDLDGMPGSESHPHLSFVSAPRRSYDFLHDVDDSIPGSAPSLLNPRKNPFDLPSYDLVDHPREGEKSEQRDPSPVPVPRELLFTRHESFSIGAFTQERRPSRFNFFLGDQKSGVMDSVNADVQRLLQEARASRISFSSESDSVSETSQGEQDDLPQVDVGNTEQIESKLNKMDTDHGTHVAEHYEPVQDDISEGSISSSLVTFAEKAEVTDDKYENDSSAPSEEEKGISLETTQEQVISSLSGDSRDLMAVASDAMNVNNQVYHNLLREEPEIGGKFFKTSTHKKEIDGSDKEFMKSMSAVSDAETMDEADEVHQALVLKEFDQISASSENNSKTGTCEQGIGDTSDALMKMDKADKVHQNLIHEQHVQVCTSPEGKDNTSSTITGVQEISGYSEDSMNSAPAVSDTVNVDEKNLVSEESVHGYTTPGIQIRTAKTSTRDEQVNGGSREDSMDSMVVSSDIRNMDKADEVNQKIVVEPVHGSTSREVENNNSRMSTRDQVIGSSSRNSMDVDSDTGTLDKTDQVGHNLVHEEPVRVSTSPEAENNGSKRSTHEQEIGGSSKESMNSVAVNSDNLVNNKAGGVHQNLNHEESVHVTTSLNAENSNLKTSTHDQTIGETYGVPIDSAALDYAVNMEQTAQVDDHDASSPGKGDSNDKEISVSGTHENISGEGSPLKGPGAKETSESKDLDAAGNYVSRVQEDLGG